MLGLSYGEVFLLIGATAVLIGPKDLPKIARMAGRLAGRSIGYVQMARGQLDNVMQQSQATQVHKELQDAMAQLDAIRYEIRSISVMNPGPITRRFVGDKEPTPSSSGTGTTNKVDEEFHVAKTSETIDNIRATSYASMQSQALAYARLAESSKIKLASGESENLDSNVGLLNVLPVSAESAGLLPKRKGDVKGSDIVLEAILEAEVAHNAKHFFAQPENQIKTE